MAFRLGCRVVTELNHIVGSGRILTDRYVEWLQQTQTHTWLNGIVCLLQHGSEEVANQIASTSLVSELVRVYEHLLRFPGTTTSSSPSLPHFDLLLPPLLHLIPFDLTLSDLLRTDTLLSLLLLPFLSSTAFTLREARNRLTVVTLTLLKTHNTLPLISYLLKKVFNHPHSHTHTHTHTITHILSPSLLSLDQ
jgi:hypothetical protein